VKDAQEDAQEDVRGMAFDHKDLRSGPHPELQFLEEFMEQLEF
jgi:hypothetical protein